MSVPTLIQHVLDVRTVKLYQNSREARADGAQGRDLLGVVGSSIALEHVLAALRNVPISDKEST